MRGPGRPAMPLRPGAGALLGLLGLGLVGTVHAGAGRTIEETESIRVAAFWLVFIILSVMVEKMFHFSEHSLEHAGKKGCVRLCQPARPRAFQPPLLPPFLPGGPPVDGEASR